MQRSLAGSTIECAQALAKLSSILHNADCERRSALTQSYVEDFSARFRIWAGNLGAFQRLPARASIDHRLRESPKIATQIQDLLLGLRETINDSKLRQISSEPTLILSVCAIASGERPNREFEPQDEDTSSEEDEHDTDAKSLGHSSPDSVHLSEAEELFESVKDTLTGLFRLAMIIRKASPRDRFAKALSAQTHSMEGSI
jgi:hypothetical protein